MIKDNKLFSAIKIIIDSTKWAFLTLNLKIISGFWDNLNQNRKTNKKYIIFICNRRGHCNGLTDRPWL